ncbi:hydroxyisourate hydrolase [Gordonia sp. Z-3]|uniref:5-hydroxyisourate hydrolase n=2 Tax=Gordonia TaxID=2053 RepID=A0A9X3D4V6_9ACTN|nr:MULTISPECIES: hydroxyisourate hydrolase [Gordonia]MAU83219.1 hydroxyisourate hydrolase [Gordonia sp. (in: high G+C Gram-positive bacteria)]MAU83631.1 hydroxyisourate hydrolase [Gordonia sp. (in: high G+C Gram-positive bacteria)]MCF3939141.1 hydroxyisourate hydrolase [Gordonia tangerina]MCX2964956.1 hydroxyisourate hydrolase [Gordonia aquimaris]MED5801349.1 hydroxyisourate hydrolase [Gordonia sp. Z-3]
MTGLSTHVLDAVSGAPAVGVAVSLQDASGTELAAGVTDGDGRIAQVNTDALIAGIHHLVFDTGSWFADQQLTGFYPEVDICFEVGDPQRHHHVPLLLSPYAYSTYRGS